MNRHRKEQMGQLGELGGRGTSQLEFWLWYGESNRQSLAFLFK